MGLRHDYEESDYSFTEHSWEYNKEEQSHRTKVRKMLEDRLERKRLKEEIDELDGEFDWDDLEK